MGLISDLLLLPVFGPYHGLKAVLEAIRDEADAARLNVGKARGQLSDLELRRDLGEISDEEYQEQEAALLERLNATLASYEDRYDESAVTTVDGEVVEYESDDGESGYVEYVDGEFWDEGDDAEDERLEDRGR